MNVLDIGEIDQMAQTLLSSSVAAKEGDVIVIDASQIGIDKILGGGKVTKKMNISAKAFSEQARIKIEEQGGQALIA